MNIAIRLALTVAGIGLAGLVTAQPAEAGRGYYCSCQGTVSKRIAGTYACQAYRLHVEKRPGASRSKNCLDGEWEKFKSYACGQDKCTASSLSAYEAQRAKSGKK